MSEKSDAYKIEGPFGADRRDSAIVKASPGILDKLENFLIDHGAAEVREGISRQFSTSLNADYPVIALHRYYGLDALEAEVKEFYAAVDGASSVTLKKYDSSGPSWDTMQMPPGVTLTTPANGAAVGNFEQFKERTYFTNQKENVLMIKPEDSQVYEAGIPEADAELEIAYMESLTTDTHANMVANPGTWAFYTDGDTNKVRHYLDAGFERHTEGDYGLTLEQSDSGKTLSAIYHLPTSMDLEWFYKTVDSSTITTADTDGVLLTDTAQTFTSSYIGLQVENETDGSTAVILSIESTTSVITTPLKGGTDNQYGLSDVYSIGTFSTEYDYIAADIFRFSKGPIDELTVELSEHAPTSDGHFVRGHLAVVYTDNDFEHFSLKQRTLLAQWTMDPYSNRLFFGRFRKKWFISIKPTGAATSSHATQLNDTSNGSSRARPQFTADLVGATVVNVTQDTTGTISAFVSSTALTTDIAWTAGDVYEIESSDDFNDINYIKFHLMHNAQTTSSEPARVTIDNVRLLKTPPIPAELSIQVATCDAREVWTNLAGSRVADNYWYATEGLSCKQIPSGTTAYYAFGGPRDFSEYGEGTAVDGSDLLVFDVGGELDAIGSLATTITFTDSNANIATGLFTVFGNLANTQERSIHIQEFQELGAVAGSGDIFDWSSVTAMTVINAGFTNLYIDNIRIKPPSASKLINKFMPLDLILGDLITKGVEHFFGENSLIDIVADWLFAAYTKFTRKAIGQGQLSFPDYSHGRYKVGEKTLACLGMRIDAGGEFTVTFTQDDDLTEYNEFNYNLDGFLAPRQKEDDGNPLGVDWIEIPATDSDEFSIWMSSPDFSSIRTIRFRLYANANAEYTQDTKAHSGINSSSFAEWTGTASEIAGVIGRRVRNESWAPGHAGNRWGIIGWASRVGTKNRIFAWGMSWNVADVFTIDYAGNSGIGFGFGALGGAGKPEIDKDNYYEYTLDVKQLGGSIAGIVKGVKKTLKSKEAIDQEEALQEAREIFKNEGIHIAYEEKDVSSRKGWTAAVLTWKRSDFIPHLKSGSPWSSMQSIAAHEIAVKATSKKDAFISFQDFRMTKKGAVEGENLMYKIKLEDDQGFLGPSSEPSYGVTAAGNDISLSQIYIPYDARIIRKRIYRTDSQGIYRYLDAIERLEDSYVDQIPEDLLGEEIETDSYRPPKARNMRLVDNRMAYIDCIDRRGTRRSSRIHFSRPFVPHQVDDGDCFDISPEDGQRVIWCEGYYGHLIVWKERSLYTVDPITFDKTPRDPSIGCIAPLSVASIPGKGFGWLSHEGVMFGDHTTLDHDSGEQIWDDIKTYTPSQLSRAVGWYHDRYYYIFFGYGTNSTLYATLSNGYYNGVGYACYIPNMTFTKLTNWNVQAVSVWKGGTDNNEIYTGSRYGYVNKLFDGEVDLTDNAAGTESQIVSHLKAIDYDFSRPHTDKYLNWIIFHAKNLSSDPSRKAMLTFTPYYDQVAVDPMNDERVEHSTYKKYDLCHNPGDFGTLLGFTMDGIKRYALKDITMEITDLGFRPVQKRGTY